MSKKHPNSIISNFSASLFALLALASGGCASIVHNGNREVALTSQPSSAKVSVYRVDKKGAPMLVMTQTTPCILSLKPGAGYFKGQPYRLTFELAGHAPSTVELTPKLSGWYFGNIVFGGLIGILIVDPATGAMWNLSADRIDQPLTPDQHALLRDGDGFMVKLASQVTPAEAAAMVRIN